MTRVERYEEALKNIAETGGMMPDGHGHAIARIIARRALEEEIAWPGEAEYNHPKDFEIARKWMERHARADELIFVKGRPFIALYYEPVADHYEQARKMFREIAERLRNDFERNWND